jgi:hypothetical protein
MGKVGAQITMSLDGYVAGPNDVEREQVGVVRSPWVTHLRYGVLPA